MKKFIRGLIASLALLIGGHSYAANQIPLVLNPTNGTTQQLPSGNFLTDHSGNLFPVLSGAFTAGNCIKFGATTNQIADAGFACVPLTIGGTSGQIEYNNGGNLGGFTMSGDATVNTSTGALTLTSVVTAGSCTNCNVTFDAKGRATAFTNGAGGGVTSFNTRTGAVTLAAADVGAVITATAPAHQWFNALSSAGVFSSSQPAFSDISGTVTASQGGLGISSPTAHGILIGEGSGAANSLVCATNQYVTGVTGSDPICTTISGTVSNPLAVGPVYIAQGSSTSTSHCTDTQINTGSLCLVSADSLYAPEYFGAVSQTPTVVQTGTTTASNYTVVLPAAPTAGDILIGFCAWTAGANSTSAGWTSLAMTGNLNLVWHKVGTGESATVFPCTGGGTGLSASVAEFSGVDSILQANYETQVTGSGANQTLTPHLSNDVAVFFAGSYGTGGGMPTLNAGWTNVSANFYNFSGPMNDSVVVGINAGLTAGVPVSATPSNFSSGGGGFIMSAMVMLRPTPTNLSGFRRLGQFTTISLAGTVVDNNVTQFDITGPFSVTTNYNGTVSLTPSSIAAGHLLGNSGSSSAAWGDTSLTALMDQVLGSTQGSIAYRNASQWIALPPGSGGQCLLTNGAGNNPYWGLCGSGGGGGTMFTPPAVGSFTYSHQPTGATATNITGSLGIQMYSPALGSTFNLNVLLQSAPSTPWTLWTRISSVNAPNVAYANFGMALADGSGKLITYSFWTGASSGNGDLQVDYYNSYTSRNTANIGITNYLTVPPLIGINDDGTNLNFLVSFDGVTYFVKQSLSRTAFLTSGPTQVGLFSQGYSQNTNVNFSHWATTLPGPM